MLVAEGMNVREIAAPTARQVGTIRSHVQHMFARHGLARQAGLVRLVLTLTGAAGTPVLKVKATAVRR